MARLTNAYGMMPLVQCIYVQHPDDITSFIIKGIHVHLIYLNILVFQGVIKKLVDKVLELFIREF